MTYELGDVFSLGNDKYMVAETSLYMDVEYLLLNKLDIEEEPTKELYVYKKVDDGLLRVTEKDILDILIPVFNNKIQKDVANFKNEEKFNI